MKITILIDNESDASADLLTEHGLSMYFEVDNLKWLVDVGASGRFAENAIQLGVEIADVDYLVLSHAHYDHTGGLEEFVKHNSKAKIYLSSHIAANSYFSTRGGAKRNISMDESIVENNQERFISVDSNTQISESVTLVCDIPTSYDIPKANRTLFVNDSHDDFRHEMALYIDTPNGSVVISACTHLGILNTLSACPSQQISTYIGGTHLIDSNVENQYETDEQLAKIADAIKSSYPQMKLITGHCTGMNAQKILSEKLGEKFHSFYSGFSVEV